MATDTPSQSGRSSSTMAQLSNGASGLLGIFGSWADGQLAKSEAKLQSTLSMLDSQATTVATFRNEEKYRKNASRQLSSFMTQIGKAGVRFEGSAARAFAESAINVEKNILEERFNGLDVARQQAFQASVSRAQGKNASAAARLQMLAGAIDTGAKAFAMGA